MATEMGKGAGGRAGAVGSVRRGETLSAAERTLRLSGDASRFAEVLRRRREAALAPLQGTLTPPTVAEDAPPAKPLEAALAGEATWGEAIARGGLGVDVQEHIPVMDLSSASREVRAGDLVHVPVRVEVPTPMAELFARFVSRAALGGDARRASMRLELGTMKRVSPAPAGDREPLGELLITASGDEVEIGGVAPAGVDAARLEARVRSRLAARGVRVTRFEVD